MTEVNTKPPTELDIFQKNINLYEQIVNKAKKQAINAIMPKLQKLEADIKKHDQEVDFNLNEMKVSLRETRFAMPYSQPQPSIMSYLIDYLTIGAALAIIVLIGYRQYTRNK